MPETAIRFRMLTQFFNAIQDGCKTTTIRIGKRKISAENIIIQSGARKIEAKIINVRHSSLEELTELDAQKDGFENLFELKKVLRTIYPETNQRSVFTVIEFSLI